MSPKPSDPKSVRLRNLRMERLRNHHRLPIVLEKLPPFTREIVQVILISGAIPALVLQVRDPQCIETYAEEWKRYKILRLIGEFRGKDIESLTDLILDEIEESLFRGDLA